MIKAVIPTEEFKQNGVIVSDWMSLLSWVVREGLSEEMTFKLSLE